MKVALFLSQKCDFYFVKRIKRQFCIHAKYYVWGRKFLQNKWNWKGERGRCRVWSSDYGEIQLEKIPADFSGTKIYPFKKDRHVIMNMEALIYSLKMGFEKEI